MQLSRVNEINSLGGAKIFREFNWGLFSTIVILRDFVSFIRCLPLL